jgi:hypothetical protein
MNQFARQFVLTFLLCSTTTQQMHTMARAQVKQKLSLTHLIKTLFVGTVLLANPTSTEQLFCLQIQAATQENYFARNDTFTLNNICYEARYDAGTRSESPAGIRLQGALNIIAKQPILIGTVRKVGCTTPCTPLHDLTKEDTDIAREREKARKN